MTAAAALTVVALAVVVPAAATPSHAGPDRDAQTPRPFTLGPNPVPATGTFTNGRGGCPLATSFTDRFEFLAPGNGTLTIIQPSTGDRVSGTILPDGTFQLRSAGESYDGRITGATGTATYTYRTAAGCAETYDARFALDLAESDVELSMTAAARATMKRQPTGSYAIVHYRVVVTNNGSSTSPSATVVIRSSRPMVVRSYAWGADVGVPQKKQIGICSGSGKAVVVRTCRVPELHRDESAGIRISARAARPGIYVTSGTVTGVNLDPVLANNRATRRTTVRR